MEEEQESSGRESEEGPLIYPDFEYEVTFFLFTFLMWNEFSRNLDATQVDNKNSNQRQKYKKDII